jgi:hypothetical protein
MPLLTPVDVVIPITLSLFASGSVGNGPFSGGGAATLNGLQFFDADGNPENVTYTLDPAGVPEPATWPLSLVLVLGFLVYGRRRCSYW